MNSRRPIHALICSLTALALLGLPACGSADPQPVDGVTTPAQAGTEPSQSPATQVDRDSAQQLDLGAGDTTITSAGTYRLTGSLTDGQLLVDVPGDGVVELILDGATLSSSTGSPFVVADAGEVVLWLEEGTTSTITDAHSYADVSDGAPNSAIDATSDLVITGEGELMVTGNNEDAINTNDGLRIESGTITVAAADDGLNANDFLDVSGGTITVTDSVEGLESQRITISGGEIDITSSDDGINISGDAPEYIEITGGHITIDAEGDGLDSNGSATMSGGTLVIHGPTSSGNGALDSDEGFVITGGTLWAVGSSGMAISPTGDSQGWVMTNLTGTAEGAITILTSAGAELGSLTAGKQFSSVLFSSPEVASGEPYDVQLDGVSVGQTTANQAAPGGMSGMGGPGGGGPRGGQPPGER